jgi:hypothetical protein
VFKAPWSGSGKGLCWAKGGVSEGIQGWCRNIADKQGCVVGEAVYDKVQDFAMEFVCAKGKVSFAGYSLFHTERGVYRSNELMSDEAIFERLANEWISGEALLAVQNRLLSFIERQIAPFYSGYLGVDMFVFRHKGQFLLHPCVEINLRMTMGMVARIFFDHFVHKQSTGRFFIDYFPVSGSLLNDHLRRQSAEPLLVENGRIVQGYIALSPVCGDSHYRARVEIL